MIRKRISNAVLALSLILGLMAGIVTLQPSSHGSAALEGDGVNVPVLASAARTATAASPAFCGLGKFTKFAMALVVTAASGTTPTLDVTWQHSIDGGTNWFTVVAFTQATAATAALKVESDVESGTAEVWGDCMRVNAVIGGTTPSFTFKVDLYAQ